MGLHGPAHDVTLCHLGQIDQVLKTVRHVVFIRQHLQHPPVGPAAAPLVEHEHLGIRTPVRGIRRKNAHRLHTGEGLETIFAVETAVMAFVLVRRAALLPRGPIVGICQHRVGVATAFRAPGR